MNILFMGRKPIASIALRYLVEQELNVQAVVAPLPEEVNNETLYWRPLLRDTARELGIPVVTDESVYSWLNDPEVRNQTSLDLSGLDCVISFLFWKKIKKPLLAFPKIGAFNFHPGLLPEFRGRRGYNFAILEDFTEYGATAHWMTENFDMGDIIKTEIVPIEPSETALSLEKKTQTALMQLLQSVVSMLKSGKPLPRIPQKGGRSATKKEMIQAMAVDTNDSAELTERRIRAFWYPPHTGATISINNKQYTLVDQSSLKTLGEYLHGKKKA
jgi:methionyl-tRNA formyltransferase